MLFQRLVRLLTTASAIGMVVSGAAHADTFYLKAERVEIQVDDFDATGAPITTTIPMWGYASCTAKDPNTCGVATVPGPAITVAEDKNLEIWLYNDLTYGDGSPVAIDGGKTSFSVSGLRLRDNFGPAFWPDHTFDPVGDQAQPRRVRSFTHETSIAMWRRYRWRANQGDMKPGTYIYHSATHQAVQVQMGLYGPLTITSAVAGEIYPGVLADETADIFYSEVDANFHADVDAGLSGYNPQPPNGQPSPTRTSAIDYAPTHYFVNGESVQENVFAPTLDVPLSGGVLGGTFDQTTLVRFRSAALKSHIPMTTNGATLAVVAETARPYYTPPGQQTTVAARRHSAVLLPALTTFDALIEGGQEGANLIVDRALGGSASGGMNAFIVLPDNVTTLAPKCVSAGRKLLVRARTNSGFADQQVISARISNGNTAEDLEIAALPFQKVLPTGLQQFRQVLSLAESAPFCPQAPAPSVQVSVSVVSVSGGSAQASKVLP